MQLAQQERTIVSRHGGFANRVRCDWTFALPLPETLSSETSGPLFCAGITVFNAMVQFGVKPSDRVGVIGVGGLGHLALQFLNKWGCDVLALTSSDAKREDALRLGAHHAVDSRDAAALDGKNQLRVPCALSWIAFARINRLQRSCLGRMPCQIIFYGTGGFPGFEPEATILVGKALRRVSWKQAELSLRHAANQFARVAIGDDLGPYANDVRPSTVIRWIFGENVYSSYLASRQERGTLDFHLLNLLHPVVLAVSAFALLLASALWWRTDRLAVCITIFTALFLMGNATVTGTLSAVHDRYQSRIVWLVPLFAVLILMRRWLKLRSFECITIRGSEQ